LKTTDLTS